MKTRLAATLLLSAFLASCQSGGDALEGVAPKQGAIQDVSPKTVEASAPQAPASPAAEGGNDEARMVDAAASIAALQKARGNLAALDDIFACYERAKAKDAPIGEAKVCAAQDFVVSKSVNEQTAKPENAARNKRAKFIAKRSAERIGAVLQAKGMNQGQFNVFGRFLHSHVLPAYQRASG